MAITKQEMDAAILHLSTNPSDWLDTLAAANVLARQLAHDLASDIEVIGLTLDTDLNVLARQLASDLALDTVLIIGSHRALARQLSRDIEAVTAAAIANSLDIEISALTLASSLAIVLDSDLAYDLASGLAIVLDSDLAHDLPHDLAIVMEPGSRINQVSLWLAIFYRRLAAWMIVAHIRHPTVVGSVDLPRAGELVLTLASQDRSRYRLTIDVGPSADLAAIASVLADVASVADAASSWARLERDLERRCWVRSRRLLWCTDPNGQQER